MDYSALHKRLKKPAPHIEVGRKGEDTATKFVHRIGYEVRERNLRLGKDEIDILAFDPVDKVLVFMEVKTRSKESVDYNPEMDMHWRKHTRIRRAARKWVAEHDYEGGYRLDLLCVVAGKVTEHLKELPWE